MNYLTAKLLNYFQFRIKEVINNVENIYDDNLFLFEMKKLLNKKNLKTMNGMNHGFHFYILIFLITIKQ